MVHVPAEGGEECCVAHHDGDRRGCFRCYNCGEWIRPALEGTPCPGPQPKPDVEIINSGQPNEKIFIYGGGKVCGITNAKKG